MRILFAICALALAVAGTVTYLTQPEQQNAVPVIYWVIDPAPARTEQIALFHRWLIKNGHGDVVTLNTRDDAARFLARTWSEELVAAICAEHPSAAKLWDGTLSEADLPIRVGVPGVEMRLDSASNDLNKKLVQGLSGVGGDVIEAYNGGQQMQYLASAGMLADVTESARIHGFGPSMTYKALAPALFYDGRQYAFPRNPAQTLYWVNRETFAKYGQPLPPSRWTIEAFEERGRAFMAAANPAGERPTVFFADRALITELRRSMGLSMFNETLTACTLDDPRNVRAMELVYKWTYEDHILPSAADKASFDTEGGWGGQSFQLFRSGRYALFASGRWALMLFRKFGAMQLAVVEPPYLDLPNTVLSGGQSTVYAGSSHRHYAELFLAYMASEAYNMQIVKDGDALPPNPAYTDTELFLRPPDHPNEWGCHAMYANAAKTIAITQSFSPYVLPVTALRYDTMAQDEVMNDLRSAEEAAEAAARAIDREIQLGLRFDANLRARYEKDRERQQRIDRKRLNGEPVPLDWISNPFHRRLYRNNGMLHAEE